MSHRSVFAASILIGCAVSARAQQPTVGLLVNTPAAQPGYTLFSPLQSDVTYLIDNDSRPVNSWVTSGRPGLMGYLTEEGHLLRAVSIAPGVDAHWRNAIGGGGRIEEYDWDGTLLWSFQYSDALHHQHHDFKKLPNGDVLLTAWTWKTSAEATAAGRNPASTVGGSWWPDSLVEIQPTGPDTGQAVWEWHVFDHLVQDFDATKANYGVVADHPELIDANAATDDGQADFNHVNGIAYNPDLDQIIISSRGFSEFWIIDHSTTTAEAASHSGGRYGHGGDLLYRWGNPQQYDRGTAADKRLFNQHDAQWIPPGCPGEGHIMVFNNGANRPSGPGSSADEIVPPINAGGTYDIAPGAAYGPSDATWSYMATPPASFLSPIIGGVQRQPNGDTLVCEGTKGNLFEVTPAGQIVWRYVDPVGAAGPLDQGDNPAPGPSQENGVFKTRRYPPDYPGLVGRTLVPGEPIEGFTPPPPVPDGTNGTTALKVAKLDATGTQLQVTWDVASCLAADYDILYGALPGVATMTLDGAECGVGTSGVHAWSGVPAGNQYLLMVGIGDYAIYESSWGTDSFGNERNGTHPSLLCGVTTKSMAATCP